MAFFCNKEVHAHFFTKVFGANERRVINTYLNNEFAENQS